MQNKQHKEYACSYCLNEPDVIAKVEIHLNNRKTLRPTLCQPCVEKLRATEYDTEQRGDFINTICTNIIKGEIAPLGKGI